MPIAWDQQVANKADEISWDNQDHTPAGGLYQKAVNNVSQSIADIASLGKADTWKNIKDQLSNFPAADLSSLKNAAPATPEEKQQITDLAFSFMPVTPAGKAAYAFLKPADSTPLIDKVMSNVIGGLGTHTGPIPLQEMAKAGETGGAVADQALAQLRNQAPMTDAIDTARGALSNIIKNRQTAYRSGMMNISADKSVLDMTPIHDAINDVASMGSYKGQSIAPSTSKTVQEMADKINNWTTLNPSEFHTPEGLDALKKAIGDIRSSTEFGSPSRTAADRVYNAIKSTIVKQAPTYAKVMGDYADKSALVDELQRTLLGTDKTATDTVLRKLQSSLRNNVNSNFGRRQELLDELTQAGAPELPGMLAGQALNSWTPRGLGKLQMGGLATGAAYLHSPMLAATIPLQMPRLMGETAYYVGKGRNALRGVLDTPASQNALRALMLSINQPENINP